MSRQDSNIKDADTFGDDVVESLKDFIALRKRGEPITVRTVKLDLEPAAYSPEQIRQLRVGLGVSQAVFAKLLAVSTKLVQHWEHGERLPQPIARRLLDEVRENPGRWKAKLESKGQLVG